jgi:hypothetical protein
MQPYAAMGQHNSLDRLSIKALKKNMILKIAAVAHKLNRLSPASRR